MVRDDDARGFTQVVAVLGPGQWSELMRVGDPPGSVSRTPERDVGRLEWLLAWLPREEHVRVRSAMQVVRLGAPSRRWRSEATGLVLDVSGGPWRGGQWAYAVRAWRIDEAPTPEPGPTGAARVAADAGAAAEAAGSPDAVSGDTGIGRLDYDPALDRLKLDAQACRQHGLPVALGVELPLMRWAACFAGDDRFVAISRMCWSAPSEYPLRTTLRLAAGDEPAQPTAAGGRRPRRIELQLERPVRGGPVVGRCRLLDDA
ncbi:MAG: hypothetical protein RJA99_2941 [Pseudomonadota bacterium]|jgi:hypothetical protein